MTIYANGLNPDIAVLRIEEGGERYLIKTVRVDESIVTLVYVNDEPLPTAGTHQSPTGHGSFSHSGIADQEARRKLWGTGSSFTDAYRRAHRVPYQDKYLTMPMVEE